MTNEALDPLPDGRELIALTEAWIAADPDPQTRAELSAMASVVSAGGDATELADHMARRLEFGTAGLRGEMGAGRNRINRLMARQTAAGVATAIVEHRSGAAAPWVLVGHDARHHSAEYAADIVAVLQRRGLACALVPGPQPTPLVAWGLRHLGAAAAVVVTASHNPAKDNGIKIYWSDGAQIVPPVDGWIADAIDLASIDGNPAGDPDGLDGTPLVDVDNLVEDYVAMVADLVGPASPRRGALRIVTTAMYGVGAPLLHRCLDEAGFADCTGVARQDVPDPDFGNITFPNPEEPGATDLLLELAAETGAHLALANDPDADRLAAGVPTVGGGWRMLSGDELGALFAEGLMDRRVEGGEPDSRPALLVTTVVSSQLLARIAAERGARFAETLTGFKWLCRPAFADPDLEQVLAYEESIGYAVGGLCDKDGISAAVVLSDLVAAWREDGRTPQDVLDDLARRHGAHVQRNFSIRVSGPGWADRLTTAAAGLVAEPPDRLAGQAVARRDQPADDVIRFFLTGGDRVVVRPSGTEPKLKCYCEAVEPVGSDGPEAARDRANLRLDALVADLTALLAI